MAGVSASALCRRAEAHPPTRVCRSPPNTSLLGTLCTWTMEHIHKPGVGGVLIINEHLVTIANRRGSEKNSKRDTPDSERQHLQSPLSSHVPDTSRKPGLQGLWIVDVQDISKLGTQSHHLFADALPCMVSDWHQGRLLRFTINACLSLTLSSGGTRPGKAGNINDRRVLSFLSALTPLCRSLCSTSLSSGRSSLGVILSLGAHPDRVTILHKCHRSRRIICTSIAAGTQMRAPVCPLQGQVDAAPRNGTYGVPCSVQWGPVAANLPVCIIIMDPLQSSPAEAWPSSLSASGGEL